MRTKGLRLRLKIVSIIALTFVTILATENRSANNMLTPRDSSFTPTKQEITTMRQEIDLPKSELDALTFNQLQQLSSTEEPDRYTVHVYIENKPTYKAINKLEPKVTYDNVLPENDPRLEIFEITHPKIGLHKASLMGIDYILEIER